jgi:hypothetical protein
MYVMLNIKLDIIYFILMINRYAFNSIQTHWQTIKWIFRYLLKIYQMKLMFQKSLKRLKEYTNFDWIDDQNIKRSISNYVFNINSEIISWLSKWQSIVILFICEVKYIDQIQIVKKIVWLRNLLIQLICDINYLQTMIIYENNQKTIALTNNFQFHARIKYIDIQIYFIKKNDRRIDRFNLHTHESNDNRRINKIIDQEQIRSISSRFKNKIRLVASNRINRIESRDRDELTSCESLF